MLSGYTADPPPALRQVADALIALRAAPSPAELADRAMIMAEFSALAEFRARGRGEAARTDGEADTLVLPVVPPDTARSRGQRHRRRRTVRPRTWRMGALVGVATAAVIVTIVAFGGNLPGPIKSLAHLSTSSPSAPTLDNSGSQKVAPKPRPHHRPTPRQSTSPPPAQPPGPDPGTLCRSFFEYFTHHEPVSSHPAEAALFGQISKLAGAGWYVPRFCAQYVKETFPPEYWAILAQGLHHAVQDNPGLGQGPAPAGGPGQAGTPDSPGQQP